MNLLYRFPSAFSGYALRSLGLAALLLLWLVPAAHASHVRAGDIQATVDPTDLLRYTFEMRIYTDDRSQVDESEADICFGDNTTARIQRQSKSNIPGTEISVNIFRFAHLFPGPGEYVISYQGNNRNGTIVNLGNNPYELSFYIETTLLINAAAGPTVSVQFANAPVDFANVGQIFTHSPGATFPSTPGDSLPTGDSLSFKFVTPRQGAGAPGTCLGANDITTFSSPADYSLPPGTFTIDPVRGTIVWNVPGQPGEFNFAFVCEQWRRLEGHVYHRVAAVVRDMQVLVRVASNLPPVITPVLDTCVVAGTRFSRLVTATDPDNDPVTLTALGQPLRLGATFATDPAPPNPRTGRFTWRPGCAQVRLQPYIVTFRAEDSPQSPPPLTDLYDWRITVVGPPPDSVEATLNPAATQVTVNWDPYPCAGAGGADSLRIYRRVDSLGIAPGPCETGIPAAWGYQYIGSMPATATSFVDTNGGQPFTLGTTYCYRLYATWPLPDGGESLASAEACVDVPGLLPRLTHATVDVTHEAQGQVTVRWSAGNSGGGIPEIISYYQLSRAVIDSAETGTTGPARLLRDRIALTDTVYVDTALNTRDIHYRYDLTFITADFSSQVPIFTIATPSATTARLTGTFAVGGVDLAWRYAVPWNNGSGLYHYVYRKIAGAYVLIDSVLASGAQGAYQDRFTYNNIPFGLERTYQYKVETRGTYTIGERDPQTSINFSQEILVRPLPCPPVLTLDSAACDQTPTDCDPATQPTSYQNVLRWTYSGRKPGCSSDLALYRLFAKPAEGTTFMLLAETRDTTFTHANLTTRRYCYQVTAVDSSAEESDRSNQVCGANCPLPDTRYALRLPNIITPNGDGMNDRLQLLCAPPLKRIKFTVYNRWGRKLYESDADPGINWRGTDTGGQHLTDGTYYYFLEAEFDLDQPVTRTFKGWVEIAGSREASSGGGGN